MYRPPTWFMHMRVPSSAEQYRESTTAVEFARYMQYVYVERRGMEQRLILY
jgi:hypothetical protein